MMSNTKFYLYEGIHEIRNTLLNHDQWLYLGIQDIKLRYRRSILGPWWQTISTLFSIFMLSFLWAKIFNEAVEIYLPYFAVSFVLWSWINAQILEVSSGLSQFKSIICQTKIPFPTFTLRANIGQCRVAINNSLIVVFCLLIVNKEISFINLLAIPNLFLIQLNISMLSILLGIICIRYQDMSQIVGISMQIIFFFTPIIWKIDSHRNMMYLVKWNPFYHWIEMIRAPLLNNLPTLNNCMWSFITLITLSLFVSYFLGRYRSRIALWL